MFERFSDDARRVVVLAQEEARLLGHSHIGTEHLLLALSQLEAGIAAQTLRFFAITHQRLRIQVEEFVGLSASSPSGHVPFTPRAKKVLELSLREALALGDGHIGSEHILLGVAREGTGVGIRILEELDVTPAALRAKVEELRREQGDEPRRASFTARADPPMARARGRAVLPSWSGPANRPVARCSFCGRDESRCEHVLVAGGVRLCSVCALAAVAQLGALPVDAPRLVRFERHTSAPTDKDAAVAAIERAFDAVFGPLSVAPLDAVWAVESGDACLELIETLRAGAEYAPVAVSDITVERVRFLDEDEAEVSLGIWIAGNQQPMLQPAHAVIEGGTWKVRRSTVEHFARQARQFRRPPPD